MLIPSCPVLCIVDGSARRLCAGHAVEVFEISWNLHRNILHCSLSNAIPVEESQHDLKVFFDAQHFIFEILMWQKDEDVNDLGVNVECTDSIMGSSSSGK